MICLCIDPRTDYDDVVDTSNNRVKKAIAITASTWVGSHWVRLIQPMEDCNNIDKKKHNIDKFYIRKLDLAACNEPKMQQYTDKKQHSCQHECCGDDERQLLCFGHLAPLVQQWLSISIGLSCTFEDQVTGGFEGHRAVFVPGHGPVQRVTCVLLVHHGSHAR